MSLLCPAFLENIGPGLCRTIDVYCERTGSALDAEPLNAVTALAMLIPAAAMAWLLMRRPNPDSRGLIIAMIVAITVGAFGAALFHTTAMVWTVWVDMAPFLVFMLLVLWLTLTRFFGWTRRAAALGLVAFVGVTVGAGPLIPRGIFPLGVYYLTPLIVLGVVAAILAARRSPAGPSYIAATVVFFAALAARELDGPVCTAIPAGTHFLWHLLAAFLAFILIRAAILYALPRRAK